VKLRASDRRRAQVRPRGKVWPTFHRTWLDRDPQDITAPPLCSRSARTPSRPGVTPVGGGLGYPRSVTYKAFGRIAAGVESTLLMAGVLRITGPLAVDDRHVRTSHSNRRRVDRLIALLAAGLLVAACSGDGRSTVSPPVAPYSTATTMARTIPPAPKVQTTTPPSSPPAATTAADRLAAQLTTAETAIRDPATPAGKLPALGRSQQRAYRALVRQPRLVPKVLAQLPPTLRQTVKANVLAGSELRKLNRPTRRLPRWRIVAPAPAAQLLAAYRAAQAKLAVPWEYLAAIHLVETRTGRIWGTSSAGAQGPMQFLPSTWKRYGRGGDIQATGDAILAAARLLRANGAPADMAAALYAYNPSRRYVRAVSAYASQLRANQRAFLGYYHWQVFYGDTLLPEGYPARPPTPAPG
jgi:membrane-bound lytic murein transglycosylase B